MKAQIVVAAVIGGLVLALALFVAFGSQSVIPPVTVAARAASQMPTDVPTAASSAATEGPTAAPKGADTSESLATILETSSPIPATAMPPSSRRTATVFTQLVILPTPFPFQSPTLMPARRAATVRMQIASIGMDAKVIEVGWHFVIVNGTEQVRWDDASHAVGHVMSSANPGEGGNIVFSGHNNIEGMVFANLWKLKVGDEVWLTTSDGPVHKYRVSEARIVAEKYAAADKRALNARAMDPTPNERVTLISCYPPTNNTDRVLVVALPEN